MTKVFKMVLVGGVLAGLMVAPLGVAQADEYSGGGNGTSFSATIPTVIVGEQDAPELKIELNGEEHVIGGEDAIPGATVGGALRVAFRASEWLVSYSTPDCPPGDVGKALSLLGKSPTATLNVSFTSITGEVTNYDLTPVPGTNPHANFALCTGI